MAFDLEPGEYSFEMKYVPKGAGAGIAVSAVSILLAAVIFGLRRRFGSSGVRSIIGQAPVREEIPEAQAQDRSFWGKESGKEEERESLWEKEPGKEEERESLTEKGCRREGPENGFSEREK